MIGQGLPGIGPVLQLPLAYLLPNTPTFDTVRKALFPFGEPDGNFADALYQTLAPAYFKKIVTGATADPNDTREFGNTVMDMARALVSTGEYDLVGSNAFDEMRRLMHDATDKARWFMIFRGVAQSLLPTAPQPSWYMQDKHGHWYLVAKVAQDYRRMADKLGWDEATQKFLDRYGTDFFYAIQPKSERITRGLTDSPPERKWEREHPDLVEKYPRTWPLFAPSNDEFDMNAYAHDFSEGQRLKLRPEEMVKKGNARIARWIYKRAQQQLGPRGVLTREGRAYLSDLREELAQNFPGYAEDTTTGVLEVRTLVRELERASQEPQLQDTRAGQALKLYLTLRREAMDTARAAGYQGASVFTADALESLRTWLRNAAAVVMARYPVFKDMWSEVFEREFRK
jgi:hypothetical protein